MDEEARRRCLDYVVDLFAPEDPLLVSLREVISEQEIPEIYISPDEGRLLQLLLRAVNARRVLELGTLGGYSAIWMARSLPPDGHVITVERDPARADVARHYLERGGLASRVEVRVGEAMEVLESLAADPPFDAVFIDADKANYPNYLNWALDHLRPGGLVIGDNAFLDGRIVETDSEDPDVRGMREFNRRLATDTRLTSIVVPTRDGVAIGVLTGS